MLVQHPGVMGDPPPRRRVGEDDRDLERAIGQQQIEVHFQPQIDVLTGRVLGAEALARWTGCSSAEAMFARAELAGLSQQLSRSVQLQALRSAAAWKAPLDQLKLSMNVRAEDLCRRDFDDWLMRALEEMQLPASRLTIEITEEALLVEKGAVAARLSRLRDAGVTIALDDFGTGYASLSYLSALPLDILKIDGGLIANIVHGRRERIVLSAVVALARELGLALVVEGVETRAQLEVLADLGCETYQGFLGARALDEQALADFVVRSSAISA